MQPEDGMMDDVQLDGAQDLDDEIPDADDEYGIGDDSDDDEDENEEDDDEDENEEPDSEDEADEEAVREERQNDLMASRLRMTEDAFREALIRGNADGDDMYGDDEELEEGERSNMLDEDDFGAGMGDDMGLDMDANLDDDIPEAEDGGYEHTDSEADLTSSEEEEQDDDDDEIDEHDISFAPRAAPLGPPLSPTIRSRTSMSGPRNSMDLSTFLSQDESSFMASSPAQGRRARQ
ncbi:hypothetical protein B0I35DRAFT_428166 [Stachybotrys elegans]|uniref:Uncharacterized protein n=1 Tax=Stachybotrys elegans TaxID=80388 RepID=A0A8K0SXI2_9HYPO|nr:hypothetical protein B0I35DRAFT_428166 [Stachybotrys elegans]